jgi:DNA-binding HxlR family transcriptional regulator
MTGAQPRGVSYRQAVEIALRLLSGQWVVAVLAALAAGPLPFGQIVDEVNAVEAALGQRTHDRPLSTKVLARTLDRMERDRLVTRHEHVTTGRRAVTYELTRTGQTLLSMLRPLAEWTQAYEQEHHDAPRRPP